MTVKLLLREVRSQKGLTLENVARSTGLSVSFISDLDRGLKYPSFQTIGLLCKSLEVPPSQLVGYEPDEDDDWFKQLEASCGDQ